MKWNHRHYWADFLLPYPVAEQRAFKLSGLYLFGSKSTSSLSVGVEPAYKYSDFQYYSDQSAERTETGQRTDSILAQTNQSSE